jgi:hypothetical protein
VSTNFRSKQIIIPSGAMTGTSTITSQPFDINKLTGGSFQAVWTGTPTGTFSVYVSNDYMPSATGGNNPPANPGTWDNIGASIPVNPAGSAGHTFIPIFACGALWIALWYTNASGTGVLSGTFAGKFTG